MRHITVLIFAIVLIGTGCSSDETAVTTTVPMSGSTIATGDTTTTTTDTTVPGKTSAASTTAVPTTTTTQPPRLLLPGLDPLELTGPTSGEGLHPELSWKPFEGAGHYVLYLYTPEGEMYWSWQGNETSVPVGGRPQLPDDAAGPAVIEGMSWAVVAYDADQIPIGSSELAPIGP